MELKEKILISTKPPKEHIDATTSTGGPNMKRTERVKYLSKIIRKRCLQNDKSSSDEEVLNVPLPERCESGYNGDIVCKLVCCKSKALILSILYLQQEDIEDIGEINEEWADEPNKTLEPSCKGQMSQDYKNMITIHGGKEKGKSLLDSLKVEENVKRVSVSEPQLTKFAASRPGCIIE